MDNFINKKYAHYDYTSRYSGVPYYFDKDGNREIYGIGSNMSKDLP